MGKGSSTKVYDYYMSIALGVCVGPIQSFNHIRMKDKFAMTDQITAETDTLELDKKKLFGGDKGEGGPRGYVDYRLGTETQLMSEVHASKHDDVPANLPGYRKLAYLFFHGRGGGTIGFRWTVNSAYFPTIEVGVTRPPDSGGIPALIWPIVGTDANGDYIIAQDGDAHAESGKVLLTHLPDANPAAMIYEVMTSEWGMRELASSIEYDTFAACAHVLQTENFGLSMIFSEQDEAEKFIGEILDHIRAVLFEHPVTGKWNLKLIRDDYEASVLPVYDPSNATLEKLKTRTWGDTVNEIVVSYTNPENEEAETVSAMNYANITIQGGVKTEERDYHGVRNPWLALELAERDVYEASRTLKSLRMALPRGADLVLPGSVIKVTWPEEELNELICRVMKVDKGDSDKRHVIVDLVEDIFATKRPVNSVQTGVFPDQGSPEDLDRIFIFSVPASILSQIGLSPVDAAGAHPAAEVAFLADSTTYRPYEIDAIGNAVLGNGSTTESVVATFLPSESGTLGVALTPEVRSDIPEATVEAVLGEDAAPGDVLIIGTTELNHELIMLDTHNTGASTWTVIRGLYDTQPKTWTDGELVWRMDITDDNLDSGNPVVDVQETYKFLPTVGGSTLDASLATAHDYTPTARASAPYRPANCQVDGNGFDGVEYLTMPASIPITWENRNRLSEDAVAMAWNGGNVTPEVGQTTTLRFTTAGGATAFEVTDLTGTSYDLDPANLTGGNIFYCNFISVRDGIECVYPVVREIIVPNNAGWNFNWNNNWN